MEHWSNHIADFDSQQWTVSVAYWGGGLAFVEPSQIPPLVGGALTFVCLVIYLLGKAALNFWRFLPTATRFGASMRTLSPVTNQVNSRYCH